MLKKRSDGGAKRKLCGIRSSRISPQNTSRYRRSGSPFNSAPGHRCSRGLIALTVRTAIRFAPKLLSLGVFLNNLQHRLALFCSCNFRVRRSHPLQPLKAGYTIHSVEYTHRMMGLIFSLSGFRSTGLTEKSLPGSWVGSVCHYGRPKSPFSQHPPQTGRKKQTQGASSICLFMRF